MVFPYIWRFGFRYICGELPDTVSPLVALFNAHHQRTVCSYFPRSPTKLQLFVTSTSIILCAVFIGLIRLNNHVVAIVELVLFCVWWILWLALAAWYADLMSSWGYFDSSFPSYRYYSALAFFSFCWITWGLFTASVVLIIVDAVRNKTLSSRPMVAAPLGVPSGAFHPSVSIPSPAITSPDSEKV